MLLWNKIQPPWDLGSGGTSSSDFLCLQAEKISDLELRLASFGLYRMKNFSVMHKMHFFVTGLKEGRLVLRNFQVSFGFSPAVFWKSNTSVLGSKTTVLSPETYISETKTIY